MSACPKNVEEYMSNCSQDLAVWNRLTVVTGVGMEIVNWGKQSSLKGIVRQRLYLYCLEGGH
jgi:hypothetical protein